MTTRGLEFKRENSHGGKTAKFHVLTMACMPPPPQNASRKNSTGSFRIKTNRLWWFGLGMALAHRERHYWEV